MNMRTTNDYEDRNSPTPETRDSIDIANRGVETTIKTPNTMLEDLASMEITESLGESLPF